MTEAFPADRQAIEIGKILDLQMYVFQFFSGFQKSAQIYTMPGSAHYSRTSWSSTVAHHVATTRGVDIESQKILFVWQHDMYLDDIQMYHSWIIVAWRADIFDINTGVWPWKHWHAPVVACCVDPCTVFLHGDGFSKANIINEYLTHAQILQAIQHDSTRSSKIKQQKIPISFSGGAVGIPCICLGALWWLSTWFRMQRGANQMRK